MLVRLQGLHEILFGAAGRERFPPIADIRKLLQDALALLTDQVSERGRPHRVTYFWCTRLG